MSTPTLTPDVLEPPPGLVLEEERDLEDRVIASAVFDATETYRYLLTRVWEQDLPLACWVMLNPSTASAAKTDATLTRVVDFSARFGCGGCLIVNLFAYRSRHPNRLLTHPDPAGVLNDSFIQRAIRTTNGGPVIAAWGSWGHRKPLRDRVDHVRGLLRDAAMPVHCLGTSSDSTGQQPFHPLMLERATPLIPCTP
jgi:Uncharacterized protein conserved in bacteria